MFSPDRIPELIHRQLTNASTTASPWMTPTQVNDLLERARETNRSIRGHAYKRTQTITDLAKEWWMSQTGGKIPPSATELFPEESLFQGTTSRKRRSHQRRPTKRNKRRSRRQRRR